MPGQHLPADHSRGDTNTIGGYAAVHGRPAAFEGPDGFSYSVEIVTAPTGRAETPWAAFLLFVQWTRMGHAVPNGHLESDYLAEADEEADARDIAAALSLSQVRGVLHALVSSRAGEGTTRRWYDVMNDEHDDNDGSDMVDNG